MNFPARSFLSIALSSLLATSSSASKHSTPYPNKNQIGQIFDNLASGDDAAFLSHVAPDVNWTVMGTHPLAGQYNNRTIFVADALNRIYNVQDPSHPFKLTVINIIGGGHEEWSVEELHIQGLCKNGLVFDNRYSWVTRWNTDGLIVETRAYLDSALVARAITENESGEYTYTDSRTALTPGPVGAGCSSDD